MARCSQELYKDWHYTQCSRAGKLEWKGKLYCSVHHPGEREKRAAEKEILRKASKDLHINAAVARILSCINFDGPFTKETITKALLEGIGVYYLAEIGRHYDR